MATETSTAPEVGERRVDWIAVGVGGAAVLFAVVLGIRMITEYRRFAINAFDLGIFDQGLWLLSRFEIPFSTVRGLLLFGDHSSYILLLLAPLYWVLPDAEALLVLTVVVIAVGGPLAYLAARAVGAPRFMAALVGIGYLAHPAVGWNARDGFHPEQFVLPLLIAAFLLFARDRDRWAIAVVIIALLAKEDVGIVVIPFALFVWWFFGKRRQALIMGAFSVASPLASDWAAPHPDQDAARAAIALIPPDATVSAWNTYVPHLTHRRVVYQFPNPWQRHNYSAPGLPLPDPVTVEWVLVRDGIDERVVADLIASDEFEVVYRERPVLLLHRISG